MKKLLTSVLLFALLVSLCACGKDVKAEYTLPEEIRYADGSTYRLTYDGNELRIGSIDGSYRLLRCDDAGRMAEDTEYTPNGDTIVTTVYEYDKNGNLTEKRKQTRSGRTAREVYTYDEHGNLLSWRSYWYDGELSSWYEYTYDENGNETARVSYDADGKTESRSESVYDENGNETIWISYGEDGTVRSRNEYTYDEQGRQRTWSCFEGGTFRFRQEFVYDENGNLLQTLGCGEDGTYDVVETHAYDEQGNEIEYTTYDSEGEPFRRHTYAYDESGHQTGETVRSADGSEEVVWQVKQTVTASATEAQEAFYRLCIEKYARSLTVY